MSNVCVALIFYFGNGSSLVTVENVKIIVFVVLSNIDVVLVKCVIWLIILIYVTVLFTILGLADF